ncbi:MAG TPA: hypothetical protein VMF66_19920 [Candidatus Acidoferrum sp.]|nr:hypothetical protein [Candidatus Acidoferrum sp.]
MKVTHCTVAIFMALSLAGDAARGQSNAAPVITTVAGADLSLQGVGGPGPSAALGRVVSVAVDPTGRPVFADPYFNLILRIDKSGNLQIVAGNNVQLQSTNTGSQGVLGAASAGGFSGDGGPANAAALNRPQGVVYDPSGNLYIADKQNNRIRKVTTDGTITTFAGNGKAGFTGDGGLAITASLNLPDALAMDGAGNLYVNDALNYRIRKITPQGIISTIAGDGTPGSISSANCASTGLYVEGIAADGQGNLYMAEFRANRVRKIAPSGLISLVAGTGCPGFSGDGTSALTAQLAFPAGVAVDAGGNVYIADTGNEHIRKVANGIIMSIAGNDPNNGGFSGDGGPATRAGLWNPFGISVSASGDIYFADRDNFRIRHIDPQGVITTLAGNGRLLTSEDNAPAIYAPLLDPFGVSVDNSGDLLVADSDNNLIRKVSAAGTLTTIAGNGAAQYTGDDGPATQASFFSPLSASPDVLGNIYIADAGDAAVRRINPNGTIATIAGGTTSVSLTAPAQAIADASGNRYIADFFGGTVTIVKPDGSSSILLSGLANPAGLALDSAGNLYFSEFGKGRVQKIGATGGPTIVAGGGQLQGAAADGGPAKNAQLAGPAGLAFDAANNLYFADARANLVRKVGADGNISTVAGNGRQSYSGDGGLATSASLNFPWGVAVDKRSGAIYIADALNNRIRELLPVAPTFTPSINNISLSAISNGSIGDAVSLGLNSSLTGLIYAVSTAESWVVLSPADGAMPASLSIRADPTGLNAGSYPGSITITSPGANPPTQTVNINLTVQPATPAALGADATTISASFVSGASAVTRHLTVRNTGSGKLSYVVTSIMSSGSGWLSASAQNGTAAPDNPDIVTVTINPANLAAGTYTGNVVLTDATDNSTVTVPVIITVNASPIKLQLTQTGMTFRAVLGGGAPLPQTFGIFNAGQGSITWTASTMTLSGGQGWLSLSASSGTVQSALTDVSLLTVIVDPSKISPQPQGAADYFGQVSVNAGNNNVQTLTVVLNLLNAGTPITADVQPAALVFTGSAGMSPSSQTFSIADRGAQPLSYTSSRQVSGSQQWFVNVPDRAMVNPGVPANVVVQPDFTSLSPGVYNGSINIQFSDGTSQQVNVVALVGSAAATSSDRTPGLDLRPRSSCTPTQLNMVLTNQNPMTAYVNQPATMGVMVTDDCQNPITSGPGASVSVALSNHDASPPMVSASSGLWTASWQPHNVPPMQVTATFTAFVAMPNGKVLANQIIGTMSVQSGASVPVIAQGEVANAASFAVTPVSPGGLVSVFGTNLSGAPASAQGSPLPNTLGGTQVLLNGTPLPLLYASNSQVNAQIPVDVPINTQTQIVVMHDTALSVPDYVTVAPAQPAVFTKNQSGSGQGAIVDYSTQQLAEPGSAAQVGDYVTIYCTGLGAVNPQVPSGAVAPLTGSLSYTTNPVTVSIGNVPAQVEFSGLAPGYIGLYQVNAIVPQGVTAGDAVPVTISVAGQTSPPVTIAVQ